MYPRWLWPAFALPGVVWLLILFLLPFYAVVGVAFGSVDPILLTPIPAWNPLDWNFGWVSQVLGELAPGGVYWDVFLRTIRYVVLSLAGCVLIGYPVAYYIARHATPHQDAAADPAGAAVLDQLPDADAGLDQPARRPTATAAGSCRGRTSAPAASTCT